MKYSPFLRRSSLTASLWALQFLKDSRVNCGWALEERKLGKREWKTLENERLRATSRGWLSWRPLFAHLHNSLYTRTIQHFYTSTGGGCIKQDSLGTAPIHRCCRSSVSHTGEQATDRWANRWGVDFRLFGGDLCSLPSDGVFYGLQLF